MDKGVISTYTIVFKTIDRLLVLDILQAEKKRVRDRLISYSKYSRRGTLFIQKRSGICSDGNQKLGIIVDCTSREAGVDLSDKRTLLMKTHRPFQTQHNIF
jgi:hypothetical protein